MNGSARENCESEMKHEPISTRIREGQTSAATFCWSMHLDEQFSSLESMDSDNLVKNKSLLCPISDGQLHDSQKHCSLKYIDFWWRTSLNSCQKKPFLLPFQFNPLSKCPSRRRNLNAGRPYIRHLVYQNNRISSNWELLILIHSYIRRKQHNTFFRHQYKSRITHVRIKPSPSKRPIPLPPTSNQISQLTPLNTPPSSPLRKSSDPQSKSQFLSMCNKQTSGSYCLSGTSDSLFGWERSSHVLEKSEEEVASRSPVSWIHLQRAGHDEG